MQCTVIFSDRSHLNWMLRWALGKLTDSSSLVVCCKCWTDTDLVQFERQYEANHGQTVVLASYSLCNLSVISAVQGRLSSQSRFFNTLPSSQSWLFNTLPWRIVTKFLHWCLIVTCVIDPVYFHGEICFIFTLSYKIVKVWWHCFCITVLL